MKHNEKLRDEGEARIIQPTLPPEIKARLDCLLDALECMDARVTRELEQLNNSSAEEDLKEFVRQDIVARHESRRLPLQNALEELRAEYRSAISDTSSSQMAVEVTRAASRARAANG